MGKKFRNFCNQQSGAMRSNNNRKIPKNVLPKRGAQNRKIAQVPLRQPEIDSNILNLLVEAKLEEHKLKEVARENSDQYGNRQ